MIIFSGFFEPLFYLFFFVYPFQEFIGGEVIVAGETVGYAAFVAPALLAASAMNGAFYDATNVFWKLRYGKVYDAMLSTPVSPRDVAVGETMWAVVRSLIYSAAFLAVIACSRSARVVVGAARAARVLRDRLRLRRRRYRRGDVDAGLAGLRPDPALHAADVPLLGDVLSDHGLSGRDRVDRPGAAAVPRDRAGSFALDRALRGPSSSSTSPISWRWASSGCSSPRDGSTGSC